MFYHNGFYYLMGTRGDRITISKAASAADLEAVPETLLWTDSHPARCLNMWAPEMHFLDGRWYIYYAADDGHNLNHRMYVLESAGSDPLGPYHYKAELNTSGWAIDGTVLRKRDGSLYFLWSQHGQGWNCDDPQNLYIASMSDPWTLSSDKVLISRPTYRWEQSGRWTNEGPQIIQRSGLIHVVYSASHFTTPDYALGRLTVHESADLLAPETWAKAKAPEPVFQRNDGAGVYGPGHNSFFTSPDGSEEWIAYHAITNRAGTNGSNRATRIERFSWNSDDTPNFGTPTRLGSLLTLPGGDPGPSQNVALHPNFDGAFQLVW
jgi:GH43 family beta-xylosidase